MKNGRPFENTIQMNLSETPVVGRERFLTSRSVKKGRWVYDRGERAPIRKTKSQIWRLDSDGCLPPRCRRARLPWRSQYVSHSCNAPNREPEDD
jgi:hypothetical protein